MLKLPMEVAPAEAGWFQHPRSPVVLRRRAMTELGARLSDHFASPGNGKMTPTLLTGASNRLVSQRLRSPGESAIKVGARSPARSPTAPSAPPNKGGSRGTGGGEGDACVEVVDADGAIDANCTRQDDNDAAVLSTPDGSIALVVPASPVGMAAELKLRAAEEQLINRPRGGSMDRR